MDLDRILKPNEIIDRLKYAEKQCVKGYYYILIRPDVRDRIIELLKEQEVKTGYWIDSAGNDKCSICGEEYSDLYPDYGNTHFCPNCGAKMKGR